MGTDLEGLNLKIERMSSDLEYIKQFIQDDRKKYNEHVESSQDFRDKVTRHEEQIRGIKAELVLLKWMMGIIISIGIALLSKLFQIF